MPSFESATLKIGRANHHINELNRQVSEFLRKHRYLIIQDDPETKKRRIEIEENEPVPEAFGLLVGDAIHNLRSALDHLIWAVVAPHNPKRPELIQFPFCKDPERLKSIVEKGEIKLAGKDVIRIINDISPYRTGNPELWAIHQLDIIDKHRVIATVSAPVDLDGFDLKKIDPSAVGPNLTFRKSTVTGHPKRVQGIKRAAIVGYSVSTLNRSDRRSRGIPKHGTKLDFPFHISFSDGQPYAGASIIPTLRTLSNKVANVVARFEELNVAK